MSRFAASGDGVFRFAVLGYGVVSYAVFFATFLYLVAFLVGFGVPKTIDSGVPGPLGSALAVNTLLLVLFGVQHSVMARPAFKAVLTRVVPKVIERSTYVLISSVTLIALMALWQPIPAVVWSVDGPAASLLVGAYLGGVGLVLLSTFLIDHFDLFGLRQVVLCFVGRAYEEKRFVTPFLYRFLRHPLYVGWIATFWFAPTMSAGHLLFAAVMTAYIAIAIPMEERDLARALGEPYRRWRDRTPAFIPRIRTRAVPPAREATEPR